MRLQTDKHNKNSIITGSKAIYEDNIIKEKNKCNHFLR